jgi:hypothetical protein
MDLTPIFQPGELALWFFEPCETNRGGGVNLTLVRTENSILAMKTPFSDDAASHSLGWRDLHIYATHSPSAMITRLSGQSCAHHPPAGDGATRRYPIRCRTGQ